MRVASLLCILVSHSSVFVQCDRMAALLGAVLQALPPTEATAAVSTVSRAMLSCFFNAECDTPAALPFHVTFIPRHDDQLLQRLNEADDSDILDELILVRLPGRTHVCRPTWPFPLRPASLLVCAVYCVDCHYSWLTLTALA